MLTSKSCACANKGSCEQHGEIIETTDISIYLGVANRRRDYRDDMYIFTRPQDFNVEVSSSKRIFLHQDMNVALVELERHVEYKRNIRPICLANYVEDKPLCSDLSKDGTSRDCNGGEHVLNKGGCASVVGWQGTRTQNNCKTDVRGPDKFRYIHNSLYANM